MNLNKTVQRYHPTSMALHWVMLALFVAVYASIELRVIFEKGTAPREAIKSLHLNRPGNRGGHLVKVKPVARWFSRRTAGSIVPQLRRVGYSRWVQKVACC